jgi:hypothetical protein
MTKHPYFGNPRRNRGPTDEEIEQCFQDAWDEFGDDKSTEFLISITADRMSVDYSRVVDALADLHN